MISIKTPSEIEKMRRAGDIVKGIWDMLEKEVQPGVTTQKLDRFVEDYIISHGATSNFKGYGGFPGTICASIDEVVVHGFPSDRKLKEGEIIGIDLGCILDGWHSDSARTFLVGECSEEKKELVKVTRESFFKGVEQFIAGNRIGDIGHAIQTYCEDRGYGVVRTMVGHGIGRSLHEDPNVPNYGRPGHGPVLQTGMVLAIEPMINMGTYEVEILSDGWTCVTKDRKPSAHYENTVALTEKGVEILTL